MNTLTTQVKMCELCQVRQALSQCNCSLISNVVHCTLAHPTSLWHHTHQVTHQCTHSRLKSRWESCVKSGKHWLNAFAPSTPKWFPVLIISDTPSSSTSIMHTLTTQVEVCELCQACQAQTQRTYSLKSNDVVYTHTSHITHHINLTHHIPSHIK